MARRFLTPPLPEFVDMTVGMDKQELVDAVAKKKSEVVQESMIKTR